MEGFEWQLQEDGSKMLVRRRSSRRRPHAALLDVAGLGCLLAGVTCILTTWASVVQGW